MTDHYRIGDNYLGGYGDGAVPEEADAILCPEPPNGLSKWIGAGWELVEIVTPVEETDLQKINRLMIELEELRRSITE